MSQHAGDEEIMTRQDEVQLQPDKELQFQICLGLEKHVDVT